MKVKFSDLSGGIRFCMVVLVLGVSTAAFVPKLPSIVVNKTYVGTDASDTNYIAKYDGVDVKISKSPQIYSPDGSVSISLKDGKMVGSYSVTYVVDGPSMSFTKNLLLYISSTHGNNETIKKDIIDKVVQNTWQDAAINDGYSVNNIARGDYKSFVGDISHSSSSSIFQHLRSNLYQFGIGLKSIVWVDIPATTAK